MVSMKSTGTILSQLRELMKGKKYAAEALQAYIVPSGDAHQSEYIAARHKRREYVSKFTGSTGTAVITQNEAMLWTDGRYFIQAEAELDHNWTLMKDGVKGTPKKEEWLSKNLENGSFVGVDPDMISLDEWNRLTIELKKTGQTLLGLDKNLIDLVWADDGMPNEPNSTLEPWDIKFSGKSWIDKVEKMREEMNSTKVYALVVAALDEVAWLFNLRGSDISYNPVFMSYAIVTKENVSLFIDETRVQSKKIREHLHLNDEKKILEILPYNSIHEELKKLGTLKKKIWISSKASSSLSNHIPSSYLKGDISPIAIEKLVKNEVEISGMKNAHVRDAAALCEYLMWLEEQVTSNSSINEITASDKLDSLRKEQKHFVSLSFDTISAAGPNGAIIHYRAKKDTARVIQKEDMYVVDSGGQYLDGTTDVTRTVHFGTPTEHQKECFTRVLKGHISLASTVFPKGSRGHILDILARKSLWDIGLDYAHGTGHGVGAFLNVHEGPIGISPRYSEDHPFYAGMFVSDEPGYYEDGKFGIRIESILLSKNVTLKYNFHNKGYLNFEPVTLVPIQEKLIMPELLTPDEITWLNEYHADVQEIVGKFLLEEGRDDVHNWLVKATAPLG